MQTKLTYADAILDDSETRNRNTVDDARMTAIGAAFADRGSAHHAVHRLHDEGFRETWIGITRRADADGYVVDEYAKDDVSAAQSPAATSDSSGDVNDTRVESENWFMRFFGEGDESLHDALVRHGVTETDARAAGPLPENTAVLTVDGGNHPEFAAQIISQFGGQVITRGFGATGFGTTGAYGQAPVSRTTSLIEDGAAQGDAAVESEFTPVSYDDYGRYRAGVSVDESTLAQLREERLRVDKSPISRTPPPNAGGSAADFDDSTIDAPVVREEFFVERRPAGEPFSRRVL